MLNSVMQGPSVDSRTSLEATGGRASVVGPCLLLVCFALQGTGKGGTRNRSHTAACRPSTWDLMATEANMTSNYPFGMGMARSVTGAEHASERPAAPVHYSDTSLSEEFWEVPSKAHPRRLEVSSSGGGSTRVLGGRVWRCRENGNSLQAVDMM